MTSQQSKANNKALSIPSDAERNESE